MKIKVGIPAGLYYYQYNILWETFFKALDVDVVFSTKTNTEILSIGKRYCVDEACFPVKIYYGHVLQLKHQVDYLFIPRLTSIAHHEYICPKMGGLPDMIRQTIPNLPPIIDVDINLRRSPMQLLQAALKIGKYFTSDLFRIRQAFHQAISRYKRSRLALQKGQLPFLEPVITAKPTLNIALLGHVYTLYDAFSNMNVISKLQRAGVDCVLPDMLDSVLSNAEAATLPKKIFWSPGRQIIGSALYYMKQPHIDGMIYLMNFGCGVDSFVCDLIERRITRSDGLPFMVLTLDEHSGEAGLNTRLEAFIDMINMRKSRALQSGKEII